MLRRTLLTTLAGGAGALAFGFPARSQSTWSPTENVEIVVPGGVGGGADLFARMLADLMVKDKLVPVPVQVVNKSGGGSAVAIGYILSDRKTNPNTLMIVNPPTMLNPIVVPDAPGLKDLQPIYNFMLDDFIMVVRADAKWKTAAELAEDARKLPPLSITIGAGGPTGADVMSGQAFAKAAGIEFNRVTFNGGGEVQAALLGGHVQVAVDNPIEYIGQVEAGTVRVLGVYRKERFPELPDAPTMAEQGLDFRTVRTFRGIAMPQSVPPEAVTYWVDIMDKLSASDAVKKYIKDNLATPASDKGPALEAFLKDQESLYREMLDK